MYMELRPRTPKLFMMYMSSSYSRTFSATRRATACTSRETSDIYVEKRSHDGTQYEMSMTIGCEACVYQISRLSYTDNPKRVRTKKRRTE